MGYRNAEAFVEVTEVVRVFYKMKVMSPIVGDDVVIQEEAFCELVERVMTGPSQVFYSWAQMAAGIYETIKGERYKWQWPVRLTPRSPFAPQRQVDFIPLSEGERVIGLID